MENNLLIAVIIAISYFIIKFIEIKFIKKEEIILKPLVIDSLIVFISSLLGIMIYEQFNASNIIGNDDIKAFTSNPEF